MSDIPVLRWFLKPPRLCKVELLRGEQAIASLSLELADNMYRRARGLMGRERIEGDGMLFVYPWPRATCIWMAKTSISLDALFVDSAGRVVKIAEALPPFGRQAVCAGQRVKWVVEIAAGRAAQLGLVVGDRLRVGE